MFDSKYVFGLRYAIVTTSRRSGKCRVLFMNPFQEVGVGMICGVLTSFGLICRVLNTVISLEKSEDGCSGLVID